MSGERVGIRTRDPLIKSQMLYQLSYAPIYCTHAITKGFIEDKFELVNKKISFFQKIFFVIY